MFSSVAAGGVASAQGPPPTPDIPEIPEIPGGIKPDDTAKYRVVIEGRQTADAIVIGEQFFTPCVMSFDVNNDEIWKFQRGKGVTMIFKRLGNKVLMHRQGHPIGDTTLALVGTVSRTAQGGYNETGPPPCRGKFPSNQTDCNTTFPVNSPLALYLKPNGALSLDRTPSQSLVNPDNDTSNPAHLCGIDDQNPDTAWYVYSYPYFLNTKLGKIDKQDLFAKNTKAIVIENGDTDRLRVSGTYSNFTTTETEVTVRLIRKGK